MPKTFIPSLATLLLAVVLAWSFVTPGVVGDFGLHWRVGRFVLDHHSVPRTEFLTWTAAGHPWVTQQWLSGVILAFTERQAGMVGVFALGAAIFTATLAALQRLGREIGAEPLTLSMLVVLAWSALAFHAGLRGSLFSHLLFAVELLLVDRLQRRPEDPRPLLAAPPLLALWIGLHGLFIVGAGLFALVVAQWIAVLPAAPGARRRRAALGGAIGALALGAMLLQPHGFDGLWLPFRYLLGETDTGMSLLKDKIDEWRPLDFATVLGSIWCLFAALAVACAAMPARVRLRAPQFAIGVFFLLLTLKSKRHLPIGAMALFPVVCGALLVPFHAWVKAHGRRVAFYSDLEAAPRHWLARATPFVVATAMCLPTACSPGFEKAKTARFPMAAIDALAALPPGRVLGLYDWTGTIAWRAPAWRLFLHEDVTSYPRAVFEDWYAIVNTETGWRGKLESYRVDAVLMPSNTRLVDSLRGDPEWRVRFEADGATLLTRVTPLP